MMRMEDIEEKERKEDEENVKEGLGREVAGAGGGFCGTQEAMLFRLDAGLLFWPPFLLFLGNRRSKMFCRMLQNVN